MPEPLNASDLTGEYLSLADYQADFSALEWTIAGQESWKLERCQHFREPGFDSWQAFASGDWERSLELNEARRASVAKFQAQASDHGIDLYRVRVVEQPITPYLQWELHGLRLRAECGELIRVVTSDVVREFEDEGMLPELLTLGSLVVYRILYDAGELAGAVKITDPRVVDRVTGFSRHLYEVGEDMAAFFDRVVAPLPPPRGDRVP